MNGPKEQWDNTVYPDLIRNLPELDVPIDGVRGWLMQSASTQMVFFDILTHAKVPPHSHCAQWGMMLDGEMTITIGGEERRVRKGDQYFIPEGVEHSAVFHSRTNVIDLFDSPDRYKTK